QSLIGRRGPDNQSMTTRPLIETTRFTIGQGLDAFTNEAAVLLDPWEQPYRYAYKAQAPWTNPGYVLYSAGPDGVVSAALLSGGFPDRTATGNGDNLYADRP
ncbi:MAG TPA: prepilin-type cleavage/methylation domain-containing protein, partial [Lacunisphaera sp.]